MAKVRIVKKKLSKATLKKYGWKDPYYYELKRGNSVLAITQTRKDAKRWLGRYK